VHKLKNGRGCPLVAHCWADLQSVHGFRCYDSIAPNAKFQQVLVLALTGSDFFVLSRIHCQCYSAYHFSGCVEQSVGFCVCACVSKC